MIVKQQNLLWKDELQDKILLRKTSKYGFYSTRNFPYKDRIVDSDLVRENPGQRKPHILAYFAQ